jgi:hypothetical protein
VRRTDTRANVLRCSFCHKSADSVSKMISTPGHPKSYICDECIAVCTAIPEDDRDQPAASLGAPPTDTGQHPLLGHRLASSLFAAVEQWARRESTGDHATEELAELRRVAAEIMDETKTLEQKPWNSRAPSPELK